RVVADVDDLVVNDQARLADARLDRPLQQQLLAEDARLQHLALGEEDAVVRVPALAVADETRGTARDAPVQAVALRRFRRVVVLLGRVLGREERVVEAARRQEPAAERAQPAEPFRLGEPRAGEAGGRLPGERSPRMLAAPDVESAVDV